MARQRSSQHRENPLREAAIGLLMSVGPFFGVRYRPPQVEVPVAATPADDDIDPATAQKPAGWSTRDAVPDPPDDDSRL